MRILDVTLRDGGYLNGFRHGIQEFNTIVDLLHESGVDGIEIGYLNGLPADHGPFSEAGPCYALPLDLVADVASRVRTPLVAMLHPASSGALSFEDLARSGLRMVRIVVKPGEPWEWPRLTERVRDAGLDVSVNLTFASWVSEEAIIRYAIAAEKAGAAIFGVADTNSAFLPAQVEQLFRKLSTEVEIPLGFHAHDSKRLAHANVLASLRGGSVWIDGSLGGVGRDAGNAATEILHEINGLAPEPRHQLMRALPEVLRVFGVQRQEELWLQICANLDLWMSARTTIERLSRDLGVDRYGLAADKLLGKELPRPVREADLRHLIGLAAVTPEI